MAQVAHTTVIIPARNEERTIGPVVGAFSMFPGADLDVYVAVDGQTTDKTAQRTLDWAGIAIPFPDITGKGQLVAALVGALTDASMISDRIILCDGDYTGLTFDHVAQILEPHSGMVIGVPDWPTLEVPERVINAWPQVSGFRALPRVLVPPDAHGYLLETQLNVAAVEARLPIKQVFMTGLKAPFEWPMPPKRHGEWARDRGWAIRHGIL